MIMHTQYYSKFRFTAVFTGLLFLLTSSAAAQTIQVGSGSYTTTLPEGRNVPSLQNGEDATPRFSSEFNQLVQTNDYWSNLIYPFLGSNHMNQVPAHPLAIESSDNGFKLGYFNTNSTLGELYAFTSANTIQVGIAGSTSSITSTYAYGDWTFSAEMDYGDASLIATTGHGLPYTFFDMSGGDIEVTSGSTFTLWHNVNEVIGLTIDDVHYALFAPTGSTWSGTDTLTSSLNDKGFLSVAVLPDATTETLEFFRKHAYAQVTNSTTSWNYDELSADLTSTFTYETVLRDSAAGNLDETLTALYRHQWINTADVLTSYTYVSPRGEMKVFEGNSFSTTARFSGVLPSLPDEGNYDRIQLLELVQQVASEELPVDNTYNNGKQMGRFIEVLHIADQLGAINERDYLLSELKRRLESWFTAGGEQEYYYNDTWNTLFGYPGSFGSSTQINDHHFHAAYAIKAAATIAQYDSAWASQDNWGGMVNLIIQDANNWDRDNEMFPFLRNFDTYAGHAWASGHGDFNFSGDEPGNNQESSSESMNFASATILWGELTGQTEIRDMGIFLYTNENEAIDQYWFDVDDEVFPDDFAHNAVGIVWSDAGAYSTWFGSDPEFIRGINFLPINGGSLYLAKNPDYIIENYNQMVSELGSQPTQWKDIFWQYLSMSDAGLALSYYNADQSYTPFDGESRAHTLHWLYNMKEMGAFNTDITADVSTYAVFVNETNDTTYIAFNAEPMEKIITFSDGFMMSVPARTLNSYNTATPAITMEPAPEPIYDPEYVISIFSDTYSSDVEATFNIEDGQLTKTSIEVIDGNNLLKYENLDTQTTELEFPISVFSRTNFHADFYSADTTTISVYLISEDSEEKSYSFSIDSSSWSNMTVPLFVFSDVVDLNAISSIRIEGESTIYVDNLFFSGDTPVPSGPKTEADKPDLDEVNVISIFSDSYDNLEGVNLTPDWQQNTIASIISIMANDVLLYENFDYQGIELGSNVDVTNMEWFHLDFWTEDATNLKVYLISPGPVETAFNISIKQNSWQSIDIPLEEFTDVNLSEVFQIKFEGDGNVYLDNLYFGKKADLTEAPIPTHDAGKVVSLFSDTYENNTVDTWSATWDQATHEDIMINENNMKYYSNVNFAGIEFISNQIDATNLTNFRFDFITLESTDAPVTFSLKLVDFGANGFWDGGATDDVEDELFFDEESTPALVSNEWISFDIPIDDFEKMVTREHLSQLLFITSGGLKEFYIDNVYFYGDAIINSNDDESSEVPTELKLSQNYPNPFNPSTNIEFSLPKASKVSLIIYNSLGQQVSKLLDTRLNPGSHSITWNAKWAPTGVYFYQLKTANATLTKRMLLIK